MSHESASQAIASYLAREGWSPQIDEDGDISFSHEGQRRAIVLDKGDPVFVRLIIPVLPSVKQEHHAAAARIASQVASEVMVAKILLQSNSVWSVAELFCDPIDRFRSVFHSSHSAAQSAARRFQKRWAESRLD
jgi:hypothetical protein